MNSINISLTVFFCILLCSYGVVPQETEKLEAEKATEEAETTLAETGVTTEEAETGKTTVSPASTAIASANATATATPSNHTGTSYGASCTKNEDCDNTIGLMCNKGECDCARPKEMIYDRKTNSCLVLESFSCDKVQEMKLEEFNCTNHATCTPKAKGENQGKTCTCSKGYSPNTRRECKGDFETYCDNQKEQCNEFAMLKCHIADGEIIGRCGCYTPKENVYENGKCIALAGGSCTHNSPPYVLECIANATCILENNALTRNTTGVCTCHKGLSPGANKRCVAKGKVSAIASSEVLVTLMICILAVIFKAGEE